MKILCMLAVLLMLCGCNAQETFETVSDWYYEPAISAGLMQVKLPEGVSVPTSTHDGGSIYLCDGYTVCMQVLEAGDLDKTLRVVSGFSSDRLQLIQTRQQGMKRYDFVWVAAGEGTDQLCRGAVLDDGDFHYTLCVMADAGESESYQKTWEEIFASFGLAQTEKT